MCARAWADVFVCSVLVCVCVCVCVLCAVPDHGTTVNLVADYEIKLFILTGPT